MALVRNVNSQDYHDIITDTRTDCSVVSIVSVVSILYSTFIIEDIFDLQK